MAQAYRRILLKLGGEALAGAQGYGIDPIRAEEVAAKIKSVKEHVLATVMNSLAWQDAVERQGSTTRVQTAIEMRALAEPYIRLRAIRHLEKGRVVILGAGTGNPYFTTDTAAALRAVEINAEVLIKATKVDAVYESDPHLHPDARRFEKLSYLDALNMRVGILDSTAITICMDNDLPIIVVNLWEENSIERAVMGELIGTTISHQASL